MAPSPIPAPLPPWARTLLQLAPLISIALQDVLDHIGEMFDGSTADPSMWRHVQFVYQPVGNIDPADRWIWTMDIANITGGAIDSSWTDADYTTVDGHLGALMGTIGFKQHQSCELIERRYYRRFFNPYSITKPFGTSGPPEKIFAASGVGGGSFGPTPPQVAVSVTEKTAYPRHWGRFYIPGLDAGLCGNDLHITDPHTDGLALNVHDTYQALMAAEFFPVVPITQVKNNATRGLLTVDQVQVDNVFDVVRRRRSKTTSHRASLPL